MYIKIFADNHCISDEYYIRPEYDDVMDIIKYDLTYYIAVHYLNYEPENYNWVKLVKEADFHYKTKKVGRYKGTIKIRDKKIKWHTIC